MQTATNARLRHCDQSDMAGCVHVAIAEISHDAEAGWGTLRFLQEPAMNKDKQLPPELDPSQPDPTVEPTHEVGEQPGKRNSDEYNDPDVEPGARQGKH